MSEAQEITQLDWDMADRLRKALRFADVSVQEMADHLGLSRNSIGRYINGHIHPDLRTLRLWAMKTGAPLEWLQYGDDKLPRVDSNHQPADWLPGSGAPSTAELRTAAKPIPELRHLIRRGPTGDTAVSPGPNGYRQAAR